MHFQRRLRTLEWYNRKRTARRGSWKTHHKISTFLRRVCLPSRQVRVNLKREGSGRRSKVLFSRRRGRLYSMSTFVCRRYSRSHCPLGSHAFCIRVCVTCLRKQVSIQPRRDRFRSAPLLLIEKKYDAQDWTLHSRKSHEVSTFVLERNSLQCFYFYETNSLVEFFENLLNRWLKRFGKSIKKIVKSRCPLAENKA